MIFAIQRERYFSNPATEHFFSPPFFFFNLFTSLGNARFYRKCQEGEVDIHCTWKIRVKIASLFCIVTHLQLLNSHVASNREQPIESKRLVPFATTFHYQRPLLYSIYSTTLLFNPIINWKSIHTAVVSCSCLITVRVADRFVRKNFDQGIGKALSFSLSLSLSVYVGTCCECVHRYLAFTKAYVVGIISREGTGTLSVSALRMLYKTFGNFINAVARFEYHDYIEEIWSQSERSSEVFNTYKYILLTEYI